MNLHCVLELKAANQSFCMTLQLMLVYHHTKFGYKKLSGSEDIVWKKNSLTSTAFAVTLTLKKVIPSSFFFFFARHTGL